MNNINRITIPVCSILRQLMTFYCSSSGKKKWMKYKLYIQYFGVLIIRMVLSVTSGYCETKNKYVVDEHIADTLNMNSL